MKGTYNARNYSNGPQALPVGDHKLVDAKSIKPNPWNYNTQDETTFQKLVESMREFGFVQPVITRTMPDGSHQIINGEHRWRAATVLGLPQVPVHDLGPLDDVRAKQLTIVLNELSGNPDQVRLAELLRNISETVDMETLLKTMPYNQRELEMYVEAIDFSFANMSGADPRPPEEQAAEAEQNAQDVPKPAPLPIKKQLVLATEPKAYDALVGKLARIHPSHEVAVTTAVDFYLEHSK